MTGALKKILLVEDDPDIQLITRLSLEVGGDYDVWVCSSGTEAAQVAASFAPDMVLLDVMMPGMDGLATMDALRKVPDLDQVPIVFFTADTQRQTRRDLLRRGALGVIVKPVEPSALVVQIQALWQRHRNPEPAA